MKVLWLCNMVPSVIQGRLSGQKGGGVWVDHVLEDLRRREDLVIRILCPGNAEEGALDSVCSYAFYQEGLPYVYMEALEAQFHRELETFQPDVIHIWGTEYGHTLAMVNAAEKGDLCKRVVISIQGLCSAIAGHYAEGVPYRVQRKSTFRDLVKRDNLLQQQRKFVLRGDLEIQAIRKVHHVIGRTQWDEACVKQINPEVKYHFCNETLREPFYQDTWNYENCRKHRIFTTAFYYPVKGFHYMLTAFAEIIKRYPDATLAVTGDSFLQLKSMKSQLRRNSYQNYLIEFVRQHGLEDKIEFLGNLGPEDMKAQYLRSNVFALPSTVENSPNSLGEAMLLGLPCVASDVGGVSTMMAHEQEGYVYQSTAPYMLAHYIMKVFRLQDEAEKLGAAAREHAKRTHDPEKNLQDLLRIYEAVMK